MVLRNVHKPFALVGLLVATAVAPTACSDDEFEGCEANRTCPPTGGDDSGGGGESGGGTETGGSSGSSSGTSGAAGADDGGSGGSSTGGSGGSAASGGEGGTDDGPPTVEAFTPSDGSVDVERDIEVTAELSEPIDETTVTETSVTLTGPDGEVAGTLSIDANVISFVPDRPLYLLGTYTFALDDTVADLDGDTLTGRASAEFQVRDGRWSKPTFPFGETERRVTTRFQRNALGDVVVGTEIWPSYANVVGGVYHAAEDRWTAAEVPDAIGAVSGLGIDAQARGVIGWNPSSGAGGWAYIEEGMGWTPLGALPFGPEVTVTPGGQAMATYWDGSASRYVTRVQNLGGSSLGPAEQTPLGVGAAVQMQRAANASRR